jgi:hypothetical protein
VRAGGRHDRGGHPRRGGRDRHDARRPGQRRRHGQLARRRLRERPRDKPQVSEAAEGEPLRLVPRDAGRDETLRVLAQVVLQLVDDVLDVGTPPQADPQRGQVRVDQIAFHDGPLTTRVTAAANSSHAARSAS